MGGAMDGIEVMAVIFAKPLMRNIVHDIDPSAFITLHEVADLYRANDEK